MAQLHRLSLESNGQVWEPADEQLEDDCQLEEEEEDNKKRDYNVAFEDQRVDQQVDQHAARRSSTVRIKSIDSDEGSSDTPPVDQQQKQSFHFSDEVKQVLKHEDIVQRLVKEELLKPTKAVVLWEPPMGSVTSEIINQYHFESPYNSCTSLVIIEELPDEEDNSILEIDTEQTVTDIEVQEVSEAMDEDMDL